MEGFTFLFAYAEALLPEKNAMPILELVRPIAVRLGRLDDFTQQTRDDGLLSEEARNVRDAFKLSKSPHKLLFDEIPDGFAVVAQKGGPN